MTMYIIKMSFFINNNLQFVEINSLVYSTREKAYAAIRDHQKVHIECGYKDTVSQFILEKVFEKDIYKIEYEIIEVVKAID